MKLFLSSLFLTSLSLVATPTFAADTNTASKVTPAEKAKIEQVVHDYLINQPEVLMQAMQSLQKKQYEKAQETIESTRKVAGNFRKELFTQAGDPVVGDAKAPVTLVEFFDYQCPHCVDMAPVIDELIKKNNSIRIIFKEFPIRGAGSVLASRAALAANKQGKYYAFSHALLTANKPMTEEVIFTIAKENGLNVDQLKKDMNDKTIEQQLQNTMQLAQNLKLIGTPAIFIAKTDPKANDSVVYFPGQMTLEQLQDAITKQQK